MIINYSTQFEKFIEIINSIDSMNTVEFIAFAKSYNIFQNSNSKFYNEVCSKIKLRLDREGLAYDIVKPD